MVVKPTHHFWTQLNYEMKELRFYWQNSCSAIEMQECIVVSETVKFLKKLTYQLLETSNFKKNILNPFLFA